MFSLLLPKILEERLSKVLLKVVILLKIRRVVVEVAQVVKSCHRSYVIVELDSALLALQANLLHDVLEEEVGEAVAFVAQCCLELVQVDEAAAVRVHHQKTLELFVKAVKQVKELVERDLLVAVDVVAADQQFHRFDVEIRAGLCSTQRLLQLGGGD